jgi:nucleoside-diphosphate-sugar epimerase
MIPVDRADLEHIWRYANPSLHTLDGARLFITGGTGFFGSWLLESLRFAIMEKKLSLEIVVLTRNIEAFKQKAPHLAAIPGLSLVEGDVCNFEFPSGSFTHIIHASTEASAKLNQEQPLLMFDTVVAGTRRILDFAVHAKVKNILFTSSGGVYGTQPSEMTHVDETYLGAPDPQTLNASYGLSKRMAEYLCTTYAFEISWIKSPFVFQAMARLFDLIYMRPIS